MNLFKNGKFFIGCNYWASHAGTNMWTDWDAKVVDDDFKHLAEYNVTIIRVFPLWPVFQPITLLYGHNGVPVEYRFGEEPLPDTDAGNAGMSEAALSRFEELCGLAQKHGLTLIVGLITGWMSGRMYVPPALDGRNVITDPTSVMWQVRFIRHFVTRFKDIPVITAWDLGNECNCMAPVGSADEFYVWVSNIVGAIRSSDNTRPVISGMHSLLPDNLHTISNQAELTDILTTHPYPYYTPHCDTDPINSIRTELHATAETLFYRGIGGKPCFVEECGTLGQMFADEENVARFIRTNLFSLWAHDCLGFLWWCAYEQSHLTHAPYDWLSIERELGLFRQNKTPKPVLTELSAFGTLVNKLNLEYLPPRIVDGVCILTKGQDTWGAAYMSFILAKQAGLDLEFSFSDQPLPDSELYFMPSISSDFFMTSRRFNTLLQRIKAGATLYISINNGLISGFSEFSGNKVINRRKLNRTEKILLNLNGMKTELELYRSFKFKLEPVGSEVLAIDSEGDPVFTSFNYGKGRIFFLDMPFEISLTQAGGVFQEGQDYSEIYRYVKNMAASNKVVAVHNQNVGVTEHILDKNRRLLVIVNYGLDPTNVQLELSEGWKVSRYFHGSLFLPENDGAILEIIKDLSCA